MPLPSRRWTWTRRRNCSETLVRVGHSHQGIRFSVAATIWISMSLGDKRWSKMASPPIPINFGNDYFQKKIVCRHLLFSLLFCLPTFVIFQTFRFDNIYCFPKNCLPIQCVWQMTRNGVWKLFPKFCMPNGVWKLIFILFSHTENTIWIPLYATFFGRLKKLRQGRT